VRGTNKQGDLFDTKVKFLREVGLSLSIESVVFACLGVLAETTAVLLLPIPGRLEQETRLVLLLMVSWLQCVLLGQRMFICNAFVE